MRTDGAQAVGSLFRLALAQMPAAYLFNRLLQLVKLLEAERKQVHALLAASVAALAHVPRSRQRIQWCSPRPLGVDVHTRDVHT